MEYKHIVTDEETHRILRDFADNNGLKISQISGTVIRKGLEQLKDSNLVKKVEISVNEIEERR